MPTTQEVPSGAAADGLDDPLGGADLVGQLADVVAALGVDDHLDAGDVAPGLLDRLDGEPAVHRAVPAPEDHPGLLQLLAGHAAVRLVRVPEHALVEGQAELADRGVAAEVLVGQEQHLAGAVDAAGLVERPPQRGLRVGRRADRAAVPAGERLDGRGRVHVGDRSDDVGDVVAEHVEQLVPGVLDLADAGHVGHRAARGEVRQDHRLLVGREDVGRLGHEVHAAEDDVRRVRPGRSLLRQLEAVAGDVGELDDLVALVVVTEHEHRVAERRLGLARASHQAGVGRGGQVAGALDAALGVQVAALSEHEERHQRGAGVGAFACDRRHLPIVCRGGLPVRQPVEPQGVRLVTVRPGGDHLAGSARPAPVAELPDRRHAGHVAGHVAPEVVITTSSAT